MEPWFQVVGDRHTLEVLGIRLVGINGENGQKLLVSLLLVAVVMLVSRLLHGLTRWLPRTLKQEHTAFWTRQGIHLLSAGVMVIGLMSIWFDDPGRLAMAMGLVTAGLAFALQRVITALAGYFVILRGQTFNVGDRITMGGVRGDVLALGFMQTTIMEMGQPPSVQNADPAQWVRARQYSGRIVTVSNAEIFSTPVYNYTRQFPYLWEEIKLPIAYDADRAAAERVLLEAAGRHTTDIGELAEPVLEQMERHFVMKRSDLRPRVYWRLTDNWLELTVRFVCHDSGIREVKDAMARDILQAMDNTGLQVASSTLQIVGLPPLRVRQEEHREQR